MFSHVIITNFQPSLRGKLSIRPVYKLYQVMFTDELPIWNEHVAAIHKFYIDIIPYPLKKGLIYELLIRCVVSQRYIPFLKK